IRWFGRRREYRANTDIVGALTLRFKSLLHTVCRRTYQKVFHAHRMHQLLGSGDRKIILSEMNTIGLDRQSHLQRIVHDEKNAKFLTDLSQARGDAVTFPTRDQFVAELNDVRAALACRAHHPFVSFRPILGRTGYDIQMSRFETINYVHVCHSRESGPATHPAGPSA